MGENRRVCGFSLIEMAIAITIIGLLAGSYLQYYSTMEKKAHFETTKKRLDDINKALVNYIVKNGALPAPEKPSPRQNIIAYDIDPSHKAMDHSNEVWIGVVPTGSLLLAKEQGLDGWGNKFTYAVSARNTFPQGMLGYPPPPGIINVIDGDRNNILDIPGSGRYVVVSHGPTGAGAWTAEARRPCDLEAKDGENCNDDNTFMIAEWSLAKGSGFYDDLVIHDTATDNTLLSQMLLCNAEEKFFEPKSPHADKYGCAPSSLLGAVAACNAEKEIYSPQSPNADSLGCTGPANVLEGACIETTTIQGSRRTFVSQATATPAASSNNNGCTCQSGYTRATVAVLPSVAGLTPGSVVHATIYSCIQ